MAEDKKAILIPDDFSEIMLDVRELGEFSRVMSESELEFQRSVEASRDDKREGAQFSLKDNLGSLADTKDPLILGYGVGRFLASKADGTLNQEQSKKRSFWNLFTGRNYVKIAKAFETESRYQLALEASLGKPFGITRDRIAYYTGHLLSSDSNVDYMHIWLPQPVGGYRAFLTTRLGNSLVLKIDAIENDWDFIYMKAMTLFIDTDGDRKDWDRSLSKASTQKQLAFLNERMADWESLLKTSLLHTIPGQASTEIFIALSGKMKSLYGIELKQDELDGYVKQFEEYLKSGKDIRFGPEAVKLQKGTKVKLLVEDRRTDEIYAVHSVNQIEMRQTSNRYRLQDFLVLINGQELTKPYGSIEKGAKEIVASQYQEALKLSNAHRDISTYHPNPQAEIEFLADYRQKLMERFEKLHG